MEKMITQRRLKQLVALIAAGREDEFYSWPEWRGGNGMRAAVLKLDRNECQHCKAKGRYRRGYIVHHVKHLRDRPDLALSVYDEETGERQLVTLCKLCHEEEHPESLRPVMPKAEAVTEERWD